ncbi:peptidase c13 family protein [Besnoitia besnoiti]|uniref:Peptidase c13 family protein n=1 Tax=Besnoitia besnoiti TaxID=94643 RepID=A0A2A9M4D8_BESBE|nr:peptidase c13 family protein [Besnoitia besnoiti]PFH31171.1 peptidase c13 family protein [Besnoitia besnoiti]
MATDRFPASTRAAVFARSASLQRRKNASACFVWLFALFCLGAWWVRAESSASSIPPSGFFSPEIRNNWAVIVNTSRYWYNYRHTANALSIYHTVKRLGIPDSQIILMLSDDHACSARNFFPGRIFNDHTRNLNLYGGETAVDFADDAERASLQSVEVDYRGDEVQVSALMRLLAGRHDPATPRGKRLLTDGSSNVLLYLSGHGGEGFLKFQDWEEITTVDLGDAIAQMKAQKRFKRMLVIAETCQGSTLLDGISTPGVLGMASSKLKENSYSHHADGVLGVAVIDRWTYYTLQFFEKRVSDANSAATFAELLGSYSRKQLMSTASARTDLFDKDLADTKLTEFFAAASTLLATDGVYPLASQGGRPAKEEQDGKEDATGLQPFSVGTYYANHFALLKKRTPEGEEGRAAASADAAAGAPKTQAKPEEPLFKHWFSSLEQEEGHTRIFAALMLVTLGSTGAAAALL